MWEVENKVHAKALVGQGAQICDLISQQRRRAQLCLQNSKASGIGNRCHKLRPSDIRAHRGSHYWSGDSEAFTKPSPQHATSLASLRSREKAQRKNLMRRAPWIAVGQRKTELRSGQISELPAENGRLGDAAPLTYCESGTRTSDSLQIRSFRHEFWRSPAHQKQNSKPARPDLSIISPGR